MVKKSQVDNPEFIPLALKELGGIGEFVDVEDIFVRCHKLAPARFGWRKHNFPEYKKLSKALRDFEGSHPDVLMKTLDGLRRQFSAAGVEWFRRQEPSIRQLLGMRDGDVPRLRRDQRLLNELDHHPAVEAFRTSGSIAINKYEASGLLLCSPDSPVAAWRERIESYRAAAEFSRRTVLVDFLNTLEQTHPDWFRSGQ